jgi:predicted nucleic acid-binding protein
VLPPAKVLVPDTSVVVKWFRQGEVLADAALALRRDYLLGLVGVVVPTLLAYELANVLRYKSELSTEQVQEAVESLFDMGLEWSPPAAATMRRAVQMARQYEATVYDTVFAALAEARAGVFVTADEKLAQRLANLPFVLFLGRYEPALSGR